MEDKLSDAMVDHGDRTRADALMAGERRLLEMVAVGVPLPTVLSSLCRLIEEISSGCVCSLELIDISDMTFQWVYKPTLPPSYSNPSTGSPVSSQSGPCGMAACLKEEVLIADISSESRWTQEWQALGIAHGLRSCCSTPILSRTQEIMGTLTVYRPEPGYPTPFHRDVIRQLTHIASIAIERSRSDLALKRSEEGFRAIVETTPECVKVVAKDGTLLRVNSAGREMAGAPSAEALVGKCFYDFVVPEHRESYVDFNERVCSGIKGFLEFDILSTNGARHHMETHAVPMHDSDGAVVQLAVTRDITAHKLAEEQRRKGSALMTKVEQLSLSGSFCWNPESGSITWSDQLYCIFGIEPGARISMSMIAARVHPGDLHLLHELIERAKEGKDLEFDHRLQLPDGSVKHVLMRAHAMRDAQGRLEYIGAAQDVTERRQSEEALGSLRAELAHASRVNSLGALTASIAHEINQPLAGIMTNASTGLRMLSAERPNVEGALETVRRTIRDGHRASEVLTRLRAMFSKKVVMTDQVDIVQSAQEVIELLRSETRRRRILVRLETVVELPLVTGDRVQLQQVVMNLLLNAVEAMHGIDDRPRQMLVQIERDGDSCVRLAVTDSGTGFNSQEASKLFDAFYTTKREGMGIGLSVSRRIIENHGGRLSARSNEGFGATFSFSIPCHPHNMAAADRPEIAARPARPDAKPAVRNL